MELTVQHLRYFEDYSYRTSVEVKNGLDQALRYLGAHDGEYDNVLITLDPWLFSYIYMLFCQQWPPSDVRRLLDERRDPPNFNAVNNLGKYRFRPKAERPRDAKVVFSYTVPGGNTWRVLVRETR